MGVNGTAASRSGLGELSPPVGTRVAAVRPPPAIVVLAGGEIDRHDAAPVPLASGADLAAVLANDLVGHGQPDARAVAARGRERNEETLEHLARHLGSVVRDLGLHGALRG